LQSAFQALVSALDPSSGSGSGSASSGSSSATPTLAEFLQALVGDLSGRQQGFAGFAPGTLFNTKA
jgi:hypothetical protein